MGHNLCMDIFGGPSPEEAAAGLTVHGEASVAAYEMTAGGELTAAGALPASAVAGGAAHPAGRARWKIAEAVENESATDRPIAWTEHVTLGPPFLEKGATEFRAPDAVQSLRNRRRPCWRPMARGSASPALHGRAGSGGFTTHLMDPARDTAFFVAWSPRSRVAFGYVWRRADFPWLGVWEENYSRTGAPWNGRTLTRGMEFGASPMPETRRQMIARGSCSACPHSAGFRRARAWRCAIAPRPATRAGRCPARWRGHWEGEVRFEY
jgi:hypothetical protein